MGLVSIHQMHSTDPDPEGSHWRKQAGGKPPCLLACMAAVQLVVVVVVAAVPRSSKVFKLLIQE